MGEHNQKRLIRKIDLERFLSKLKAHPSPKASLEQYTTPEAVAATVLYIAAYTFGDITGKTVLDLGCGTGRLSIGAAFLGAKSVVGVDIDKAAIDVAIQNTKNANLNADVNWLIGDVDAVAGKFDTVVENPPFGVQRHAADRRFLAKAIEVGATVYSLHNHPSTRRSALNKLKANSSTQEEHSPFIQRFVEEQGGKVEAVFTMPFVIPHMFAFHTKEKHEIFIDLYVIRKVY
ncbi:MAG: METTL5 family protein [Candidatus Bathyarchaeia archaeon]|jgi:putative methylase